MVSQTRFQIDTSVFFYNQLGYIRNHLLFTDFASLVLYPAVPDFFAYSKKSWDGWAEILLYTCMRKSD